MTRKIIKSRNYLYIFELEIETEDMNRFALQAEQRRNAILKTLGIAENIEFKKAIYTVSLCQNQSYVFGRSNRREIRIYISKDGNDKNDFFETYSNMLIHEETHFILFNIWPEISAFFSEGIAEYVCWKVKGRPIPIEFCKAKDYLGALSLEKVLNSKRWVHLCKMYGVPVYVLGCMLVDYVVADITIKQWLDEIYVKRNTSKLEAVLALIKRSSYL